MGALWSVVRSSPCRSSRGALATLLQRADPTVGRCRFLSRYLTGLLIASTPLGLVGCTYERYGPVAGHYYEFQAQPPEGNRIFQCHGYGCKFQTKFAFTPADIEALRTLMESTRRSDTAHEERRAVAYAVAWMEKRVGDVTGTSADRAGDDYAGGGDPTQMDCVDTATNSTSYLLVLQHNQLLRHHTVRIPFSKEDLTRGVAGWPHWAAVLHETSRGQRWVVDAWMFPSGENPAVIEAEKWYIEEKDSHRRALR